MTDLTELLKEMREQCEKATPGPWFKKPTGQKVDGFAADVAIAFVALGQGVYAQPPGGSFPASDQDFIARSRTLVPALISVVEVAERAFTKQLGAPVDPNEGADEWWYRDIARAALSQITTLLEEAGK